MHFTSTNYPTKEELRGKGIKSLSKLLSPKYLSQSSLAEQNRNPSSPKCFHFINSIVILNKEDEAKEEEKVKSSTTEYKDHEMTVESEEEFEEETKEEIKEEEHNLRSGGDFVNSFHLCLSLSVVHSLRLQKMELNLTNITQLCDIDPMIDDLKVLGRCISLWKCHPAGRPTEVYAMDMVFQDAQGNRVQATVRNKNISKFQLLIDEGSCYRIGNFGVGDNGGNYPLLNHRFKMNFYKNTSVTRVGNFDNNTRGFKFEPFANFSTKEFSPSDVVDVIGTVVSMTDCIPFNTFGVDKIRRTLILKDVE
ncbi:replication protein A 70 kDa DNA-binding subunit B [Tanacetum coccineum]